MNLQNIYELDRMYIVKYLSYLGVLHVLVQHKDILTVLFLHLGTRKWIMKSCHFDEWVLAMMLRVPFLSGARLGTTACTFWTILLLLAGGKPSRLWVSLLKVVGSPLPPSPFSTYCILLPCRARFKTIQDITSRTAMSMTDLPTLRRLEALCNWGVRGALSRGLLLAIWERVRYGLGDINLSLRILR